MNKSCLFFLLIVIIGSLGCKKSVGECEETLPSPEISFTGIEEFSEAGKDYIRYFIPITNFFEFPERVFEESESTCDGQTGSRGVLEIYDGSNNLIDTYCQLFESISLLNIGIVYEKGQNPPSGIYASFTDQSCDITLTSDQISVFCLTGPKPELKSISQSDTTIDLVPINVYNLSVENWEQYSNKLFEPAEDLPFCGGSQAAPRTWVEIYNENDQLLVGFCTFEDAQALENISLLVPKANNQPDKVYVKIIDRICRKELDSEMIQL